MKHQPRRKQTMEISELMAREHIRELVASYTDPAQQDRIAEMTDLFGRDAELDGFGKLFVGHEAIAGFFGGIADGTTPGPARTFIRHHISNVTIEMTSTTEASGASYWLVIADDGLESSGRYRDTYRSDPDNGPRPPKTPPRTRTAASPPDAGSFTTPSERARSRPSTATAPRRTSPYGSRQKD